MRLSHPEWQGTFEPAALRMLREVFDEVWACIAPQIGKSRDKLEFARNDLALILLELAKDGQLSPYQITRTAARLMREQYIKTPWRPEP